MICISVTPESRQLARVDILNAARQCDIVELCLDNLIKEPDVKEIIEGAKKPILISCRRPEDGGRWDGSEDERMALLRQAIISGPAYIELDSVAAAKVPRFGKVQRVVSFTSVDRPLDDLDDLFAEALSLKADVVKFCWPMQTLETAWPLLHAVSQKRSVPIVGQGMGRAGLTFSLLGRKYGSPWIYAALEQGMEAYPGQPTVTELDEVHRWREITPKTRFVGVVGYGPTERSVCRVLNAGFDTLKLNSRCLPLDFRSIEQVPKMLEVLKVPAMIGAVGSGRKLLALANRRDDFCEQTDFADLLARQDDGWQAVNVLWKSAVRLLEETLGKQRPEDRPLDRRNVMIIGEGGPAQLMVAAAKRRQGLVSIACPDDAEAKQIARSLDARFVPSAKIYDTLADVIVITVADLDYKSKKAPINPSIFRPGAAVLDLSDLPNDTKLTEEARGRGCKVVSPQSLFLDYCQSIFKSLTGQEIPSEAAAAAVQA